MIVDPQKYSSDAFYAVMIQAIIPRPIAWVLSKNPNDSFNVAPFSFFNGVASEPPLLMISVGYKNDLSRKDTWVNIEERNEFVVHIPPAEMAEAMVVTSKALPLNESEIDLAKLKTVQVEGESLPRIEGPRVAMFCRKHRIIEVGTEPQGLILGEVRRIWLDDSAVVLKDGKILVDPLKINPVSRLGGRAYGLLGKLLHIDRPK